MVLHPSHLGHGAGHRARRAGGGRPALGLLDEIESVPGLWAGPSPWPVGMGRDSGGVLDLRRRRVRFFPPGPDRLGREDVVEMDENDPACGERLGPAWSPDGHSIYFASSRGGTMNIWKIVAAGGEPEQITSGQGDDAELDVSKDGKRIVFSTFRLNMHIVQLDLEAKAGERNLKVLTTDPARNQIAPVYSPDGKRLAYFSNRKGAEKESIWVSNADGSNSVELVQDNRVNIFPQWTPDGEHLVYNSEASGLHEGAEYRLISISGGAPLTLTPSAPDFLFDAGPQGRLLYKNSEGRVQSYSLSNHQTQTLAPHLPGNSWGQLRWSPDGHSIAYEVGPSAGDDSKAGLWVDDLKNPPRQIFRGWVLTYARGPRGMIYVLEGKADMTGVFWKVGWNGQGLTRLSATVPLISSYWTQMPRAPQEYFDVSPDGRDLAIGTQGVLQANIGMIEDVR